ncbi:MAG: serine hydrolase domain-containing protein [Actinomycetaceae bacterium]|nr:serine hydrolase domain-containing protein [Actinomycetaceae bacterium]
MEDSPIVEPESVGVDATHLTHIDHLIARHIADNAYQGMVVLVARHGKICYFKAFGKADEGVPMTTDSLFRLASMSKVPTAVAVMQLFERGLIDLQEPIANYLPDFASPQVAIVGSDGSYHLEPAKRPITFHHLLNMTSGMTNSWWDEAFDSPVYSVVPKLYADLGIRDDMNAPDLTLEENIARVAQAPLIAHPGEAFDYSNSSVDTLARLVEVVSGVDFDTYLRENILGPLGMDETWFFIPDEHKHRLAECYWPGRDEKQTTNLQVGPYKLGPEGAHSPHHTYFSGAGGLHGTTGDYYKFAQMLLNRGTYNGERILSPTSVELMTTNQIGDKCWWQGFRNKWGYQLEIQDGLGAPEGSPAFLGGRGAYSWQGYFSTKFVNNPAKDSVILTMTASNADGALLHNLRLISIATAAMKDE